MKRHLFLAVGMAALVAIIFVVRSQSAPQDRDATFEEAKRKAEEYQKAAIRINELAGNIHSVDDARAFIDEIAKQFTDEIPYTLTAPLRARVAHAEYETATDSTKLIPEQRVADAWNQWVADINGPAEARVSVAEIHNLRDALNSGAKWGWERHEYHTLWSMPNIAAVKSDGNLADGCRAMEAFFVLYQIDHLFTNLLSARERVAKGIVPSEELRKREENPPKAQRVVTRIVAMPENPVQSQLRSAESDYERKHGEVATDMRVLKLVSEVLADE
jgi:cell division protein FtsB